MFREVPCSGKFRGMGSPVDSKHDIILTSFKIGRSTYPQGVISDTSSITNEKHKILWSNNGIQADQDLLSPVLMDLMESWDQHEVKDLSLSAILNLTYSHLSKAAKLPNKYIDLSNQPKSLSQSTPQNSYDIEFISPAHG